MALGWMDMTNNTTERHREVIVIYVNVSGSAML